MSPIPAHALLMAPGASGLTDPSTITGLKGWFDASYASSITGSPLVTVWANRAPSALYNLTLPTGGTSPSTGVNTMNGLNVLKWAPAATSRMIFTLISNSTQTNPLSGASAGTMFFVAKNSVSNTTQNACPVSGLGTASDDLYCYSDGKVYSNAGCSARKTTNVAPANLQVAHSATFVTASSDWRWYRDGSQQYSTATNTVAFGNVCVTGYNTSNTTYYSGDIAEILFYNSALGTTDRQAVEGYLRTKWGLP